MRLVQRTDSRDTNKEIRLIFGVPNYSWPRGRRAGERILVRQRAAQRKQARELSSALVTRGYRGQDLVPRPARPVLIIWLIVTVLLSRLNLP